MILCKGWIFRVNEVTLCSDRGQYTLAHLALHTCNALPQEIDLLMNRIGPGHWGHSVTLQRSVHGSKGPLGRHQRCWMRRGESRPLQHRSDKESWLRAAPELLRSCPGRGKAITCLGGRHDQWHSTKTKKAVKNNDTITDTNISIKILFQHRENTRKWKEDSERLKSA